MRLRFYLLAAMLLHSSNAHGGSPAYDSCIDRAYRDSVQDVLDSLNLLSGVTGESVDARLKWADFAMNNSAWKYCERLEQCDREFKPGRPAKTYSDDLSSCLSIFRRGKN